MSKPETHRQKQSASSRPPARGHGRNRRRWLLGSGLVLTAALVTGFFIFTEFDWQRLHQGIDRLNPIAVIALMATLPVAGFSIGIFYLVAGAKFGVVLGSVVVAVTTAIHLLATHWIARSFLQEPVKRFFSRRKHRLPAVPEGENGSIAVMAVLVPGLPYFARNYLLALSGVPLRTYFWICLPIYVVRSYLVIFLGDMSGDPSGFRLLILGGVYVLKLAICGYIIARLRKRHRHALKTKAKGAHSTESVRAS